MKSNFFKEFVLDQLGGLGEVTARAMFGGHGLYCGTTFFAIVYRDRLYFKTNDASRAAYTQRGMKPFRPNAGQTMKYHEVPAEVLEHPAELVKWARMAIKIVHAD